MEENKTNVENTISLKEDFLNDFNQKSFELFTMIDGSACNPKFTQEQFDKWAELKAEALNKLREVNNSTIEMNLI